MSQENNEKIELSGIMFLLFLFALSVPLSFLLTVIAASFA